jgi:hypothetical protein
MSLTKVKFSMIETPTMGVLAGCGNEINHSNTFVVGTNICTTVPNATYSNNILSEGFVCGTEGVFSNYVCSNTLYVDSVCANHIYGDISQTIGSEDNTKLSVTGGIISGDLVVTGSFTAAGSSTFVNTVFSTTSALSVVNLGMGPALYVQQGPGDHDIASFYDADGVEVLHVGNALNPSSAGVIGIKTSSPNKTLSINGDLSARGPLTSDSSVTATCFVGSGSTLTNLNASNIGSGTLDNAYLPTMICVATLSGTNVCGKFFGDGSSLSLGGAASNASSLTTGTLDNARLPSTVCQSIICGTCCVAGTHTGSGAALTGLCANNITTGTLDNARLPSTICQSIICGTSCVAGTHTGSGAALTGLCASNIATGTLDNARLPSTVCQSIICGTSCVAGIHTGSGAALTGLCASNIATGTLDNARLCSTVCQSIICGTTCVAGTHTGSGASLTCLNAANISSGTLPYTRGGTGLTTVGTSNQILGSDGTNIVWKAAPSTTSSINNLATTTYTLQASDAEGIIRYDSPSGTTITIPQGIFSTGTQITVVQRGNGSITITPATGVTLLSTDNATQTASQFSVASLIEIASDEWLLIGDIV